MTTERQTAANRQNAAHSTGPRTEAGKAASRMNRLAHGLRSEALIVPGESVDDWNDHHAGMIESLAPVGPLETELAERITTIFWRMRRVTRCETAVSTASINRAIDRLTGKVVNPSDRLLRPNDGTSTVIDTRRLLDLYDQSLQSLTTKYRLLCDLSERTESVSIPGSVAMMLFEDIHMSENPPGFTTLKLLEEIGIPEQYRKKRAAGWKGWSTGHVIAGLNVIARLLECTLAELFDRLQKSVLQTAASEQQKMAEAKQKLAEAEERVAEAVEAAKDQELLPDRDTDKIIRYEAHLGRQLTQAFQMLERIQKTRLSNRGQQASREADFAVGSQPIPRVAEPIPREVSVATERSQTAPETPASLPQDQGDSAERSQSAPVPLHPLSEEQGVSAERSQITGDNQLIRELEVKCGGEAAPNSDDRSQFVSRNGDGKKPPTGQ